MGIESITCKSPTFAGSRRFSALTPPSISLLKIGSIYLGITSPTDAAAVGVVLSLMLSWSYGSLNRTTFVEGLMGATKTSCMIIFILAGASFLTVAMGFAGIPKELAA